MMQYYGHYNNGNTDKKEEPYPPAVRIWGHRLRTGQHWMEYMLEFLGVLYGFQYRLGQGLPNQNDQTDYYPRYELPKRLGLRRFVFYDKHEQRRDSLDDQAINSLHEHLQEKIADEQNTSKQAVIEHVHSLLRSFSVIEDGRSWYAKTLFPVHENLILWEALRKGVHKDNQSGQYPQSPSDLDKGVEFRSRNFFARGGELYYLIVSAGTEGDPERRESISRKLKELLTKHNQGLGKIAHLIDQTWEQIVAETSDKSKDSKISGTVGWIPDPGCQLYRQIAVDLDTFLNNNLDSLECLELLAHLISFHVIIYIYHRAHPLGSAEIHVNGSCINTCRPTLLVDLLGSEDGGILRDQAAAMLREQDDLQLRRMRHLIEERVRAWASEENDIKQLSAHLEHRAKDYFYLGQQRIEQEYQKIHAASQSGITHQDVIQAYSTILYKLLQSEFRKNFLSVHRKLGRAIGLIAPQRGPTMRFALGDTLLKTLVIAVVGPGQELPFGSFLEHLYERYGIIVGPGEARVSELMARLRINEEYYTRNRDLLRMRMQRAGLLTHYSDATALVKRP